MFLQCKVPLILLLILHFWNYYVTLRTYVRVTPFNHLDSTISYIPVHIITVSISPIFATEQGERRANPMSALWYPTSPPPWHRAPNHLPIIPRQGNFYAALRHFTSPCAAGGMCPLRFAKCFLHSLTLFLIRYYLDGGGRVGRLNNRRRRKYLTTKFLCLRLPPPPFLQKLPRLRLWTRYGAWWTSNTPIVPSTVRIGMPLGSSIPPKNNYKNDNMADDATSMRAAKKIIKSLGDKYTRIIDQDYYASIQ